MMDIYNVGWACSPPKSYARLERTSMKGRNNPYIIKGEK